ncbi:unnamed protein product [Effrenium voratum]|uniref:Uncharacterized protein n=1 Tax=Effrenium voratum TaxID=2562239 RepID=A0AA36IK39_9DINO|nr:unnamed protein product [Effrenium voratum]
MELGGEVTWDSPADTSALQDYLVYLGSSSSRLQLGVLTANALAIPAETPKNAFDSVLVYTRSSLVEQTSPASLWLVDNEATVANISFMDMDLDKADLGGVITWTPAGADELVTQYAVYFAESLCEEEANETSDAYGENSTAAPLCNWLHIETVNSSNTSIQLPAETPLLNYTHLAVFTRSVLVEQRTPGQGPISDASASVGQLTFHDLDLDDSQLGGDIAWAPATGWASARVEAYHIYLAPDEAASQRQLLGRRSLGEEALAVPPETDMFAYSYITAFTSSSLAEQRPQYVVASALRKDVDAI